jgi:hypothetical protein
MDESNSTKAIGIIYPKYRDIIISLSECNNRKNRMKDQIENTKVTPATIVSNIFRRASQYHRIPKEQFEANDSALRDWLSIFLCWKITQNRNQKNEHDKTLAENGNKVFNALLNKLSDDYHLNVDFVADSE